MVGALQIDKRPRHVRSDEEQDGIHQSRRFEVLIVYHCTLSCSFREMNGVEVLLLVPLSKGQLTPWTPSSGTLLSQHTTKDSRESRRHPLRSAELQL